MTDRGVSKVKLLVYLCLAVLLCGGVYLAWGWGRIEYHAQRLGAEDREVALASELALLSLGEQGRYVLHEYLLKKLNIKLPPLSFEEGASPGAEKIIAVSESGEVEVAGAVGPALTAVLLADSSAPVEKVCRPLTELARAGTAKVLAAALAPESELAALEIDLVFLTAKHLESYLTLRVGDSKADLEGTPVAHAEEVAAILKEKTADSVRIKPRPGVRYARFLRFVYGVRAAGKRPVLVFGDPECFGAPSPETIKELTRSLSAVDNSRQVRAAVRLKSAFGELFTYDTSKTPAQNRTAIEDWMKWFEKNEACLYFDVIAGSYTYDAAASAAGIEREKYWLEKLRILKKEPGVSNPGKGEQH